MSADEKAGGRVLVEEHGPLAVIRFNRPRERNRLSAAVLDEFERLFTAHSARSDISAFIFTGTGDVFTSGADIGELVTLTPETAREFSLRGQRLFQSIARARQLIIAAINGYCMGGGLDLALACDLRVASPSALFAHPGARLGIITGWGGTQRLARLVGTGLALEMFLAARRVRADEAEAAGLVDCVADPALKRACEIALEATRKNGR